MMTHSASIHARGWRRLGWILLILLSLQVASMNKGFWGAHGEARRSEVAREMLQSGDWLVPTLLGEPFITKPPLLYWTSAASMAVFGVHDWAARLPAILATLGSWLAMISLGRSFAQELALLRSEGPDSTQDEPGELAAAALLCMPLVLAMGLNAETEPLLLCCSTAAVAAVLRLPPRTTARRAWSGRLLPGVFLALGFLVKGPLGWLFPLFGILAFEWALPAQRRRLSTGDLGLFLLIQLVLVLPWFLLVMARMPEAWTIWTGESLARLTEADFAVHREPWWYYLPRLAVFLPGLLWLHRPERGDFADPARRLALAPWIWLGLGVLFLSLAASKRTHYLLSLAPAAALVPLVSRPYSGWRLIPPGRILIPSAVILLLVLLAGGLVLMPRVDAYRNPAAFFRECARIANDGKPILNWRNDRCSASFHLRRFVPTAGSELDLLRLAPGGAWLLCQERDLEPLSPKHEIILRRVQADPFVAGRSCSWVLVRTQAAIFPEGVN